MLAVVTGASGLLGGNLAVELHKAGHRVRALRRKNSKVDQLAAFPIEWVDGDITEPPALAAAFAGADAVFHCAAQVSLHRHPTPGMERVNIGGTKNVIDAVRAAKVKRLVHCSSVVAVGLSKTERPCDESSLWNHADFGLDDGYTVTKRRAEELVTTSCADGLEAVIVNPTYMFGPYDVRPSSGAMIINIAKGRLPFYTAGGNNFVDVRDVARGMLAAHERGKRGERYILGGLDLTYREAFGRIAAVVGRRPPGLSLPRGVARLVGWGGDAWVALSKSEPLINSVSVGWGFCMGQRFTSDKARRELGYTTGPLEQAIADAMTFFRQRGMV